MTKILFDKYHFLGNDFIVIRHYFKSCLNEQIITDLCNRQRGVGADGIILSTLDPQNYEYDVRFYNPDGSISRSSGSGLIIFTQWLLDQGLLPFSKFSLGTLSELSIHEVFSDGNISVTVGEVSSDPDKIGFILPPKNHSKFSLKTSIGPLDAYSLFIGEPHTVIFSEVAPRERKSLAREIANHPIFEQGSNVQFIESISKKEINIDVWRRDTNTVTDTGSCACAAAIVTLHLDLCSGPLVFVKIRGVNRHQFARHLSVIENGKKRGVNEQQTLSRRI